jgi:hypothetical protein
VTYVQDRRLSAGCCCQWQLWEEDGAAAQQHPSCSQLQRHYPSWVLQERDWTSACCSAALQRRFTQQPVSCLKYTTTAVYNTDTKTCAATAGNNTPIRLLENAVIANRTPQPPLLILLCTAYPHAARAQIALSVSSDGTLSTSSTNPSERPVRCCSSYSCLGRVRAGSCLPLGLGPEGRAANMPTWMGDINPSHPHEACSGVCWTTNREGVIHKPRSTAPSRFRMATTAGTRLGSSQSPCLTRQWWPRGKLGWPCAGCIDDRIHHLTSPRWSGG